MTEEAKVPVESEEEKEQTFGSLIDEMYAVRTERQGLEAQAKKLGEKLDAMQARIINRLDLDETTMSRGRAASATLTETVVPKVEDWDGFYKYILENEAFHLLQRRVSSAAARETLEAGEVIDGMSTFTKRAISLRKL